MRKIFGLATAVLLILVATSCRSKSEGSVLDADTAVPQGPALMVFYTDN